MRALVAIYHNIPPTNIDPLSIRLELDEEGKAFKSGNRGVYTTQNRTKVQHPAKTVTNSRFQL